MTTEKESKECDIYGCRNEKEIIPNEVALTIGQVSLVIECCPYHFGFFRDVDPDFYTLGFTFLGEVEVRMTPAVPESEQPPLPSVQQQIDDLRAYFDSQLETALVVRDQAIVDARDFADQLIAGVQAGQETINQGLAGQITDLRTYVDEQIAALNP